MPETSANPNTDLRKRRSTRIVQAVPLQVMGVDALGRPFNERTSSLIINCHGCRYQSKHYVLKNMWVTLEIPHSEAGQAPRTVRGRVAWIQRPRTVRQLFQVALELETPGNVWGIGFPPEDWMAPPEAAKSFAAAAGTAAGYTASQDIPRTAALGPSEGISQGMPAEDVRNSQSAQSESVPTSAERMNTGPLSDLAPAIGTDNVRVFPSPTSATDASLQLARQMARLLSDAQQQIQATVRETAAQAIAAERHADAQQWDLKIAAANAAVSQEVAQAIEYVQKEVSQRSRDAHKAAAEALQKNLPRWLSPQLEELTRQLTRKLSEEAAARRTEHARQAAAERESIQAAAKLADDTVARVRESAERAAEDLAAKALEHAKTVEDAARRQQAAFAGQLESLSAAAGEIKQQVGLALSAAQAAWQNQMKGELEAAQLRWQIAIDNAVAGAEARAATSLDGKAQSVLTQFQQEAERLALEIRNSTEDSANERQRLIAQQLEAVRGQGERLDSVLTQAAGVTERLEHFSHRMEAVQHEAISGFQAQLDDVLSLQRNELHRRSESLFAEINGRIRATFEESSREVAGHFARHLESIVQPEISKAEEVLQRLANGDSALDASLTAQQERIRASTDAAFAEVLAQFRGNLGGVEQLLQESSEAVVGQSLADLEARAEAVKHEAIDDLRKSTEWYEKKAQTQIHALTERASEQAGMKLQERASEVANTFAGDLDHSSRGFLGDTQRNMEEVVRDAFERTRGLFAEAAETTSAAFVDEIQRNARHELRGLEDEMQRTASETRTQLAAAHADLTQKVTAEQERFLRRFQEAMNGALDAGVADAQTRVKAGFAPLLESWKSVTDENATAIRRTCREIGDRAAEEHKARLENVSTQWLLAAAASLDHRSRDVIDKITLSAEERLRETCSAVFAGIGDALRERLQKVASNLDTPTPPKT
ncbi:MAG TPA: hypothetical protein VGI16_07610 [Candidatus Acidoferrum sp.]|jgi:vacuolar-type H+-ATPase subunit E/Vma4